MADTVTEPLYWENRKDYNADERKKAAQSGAALSDGSYPIHDQADADNAWKLRNNGKAAADTVVAHIKKRVKALGLTMPGQDPEQRSRRYKNRPAALSELLPEYRTLDLKDDDRFEMRSDEGDDGEVILRGKPIVYNSAYPVAYRGRVVNETMAPGVARDALARGADVRLLLNHAGAPFARTKSGTLTLNDASDALGFEARLDVRNNPDARALVSAINRGDISQMSIGFSAGQQEWSGPNRTERRITSLRAFNDISAVTYPASPTTEIEVAHRMAMAIPVEQLTEYRDALLELRSGKVLSSTHADLLMSAFQNLGTVLNNAGANPFGDADDGDDTASSAPEIDALDVEDDGQVRSEAVAELHETAAAQPDLIRAAELELMSLRHRAHRR